MKDLLDEATRKRIRESREEYRKRDALLQAADNKPQSVSTGITTTNATMVEPVHTIEDVVKILKISGKDPQRTVMRWIKEGNLRGFKTGKEWKVTESALEEFINKGGGE